MLSDLFPRKPFSYHITGQIGKGCQATVYLGTNNQGAEYAIKQFTSDDINNQEALAMEIQNLKLLSHLPCHPNIACYKESFQDTKTGLYYLILDYYQGHTLKKAVKDLAETYGKTIEYYDILANILVDCIKAVEYMHSHNIIHGDIKYENIQIVRAFRPILLDFGFSFTFYSYPHSNLHSTPVFMAPELWTAYLNHEEWSDVVKHLTSAVDIWSLGLCFYGILVDFFIWPSYITSVADLGKYISQEDHEFWIDTPSSLLNTILPKMLLKDPIERSSAKELVSLIKTEFNR